MGTVKSRQIGITLRAMRAALLALGHEKLWVRDDGAFVQIITWDAFVAAELNASGQGWEICPEANFIFSNPKGATPEMATELTEEEVTRLLAIYP